MLVGDLAGLPARGRPCFRNVFPQGDTSCLVAQLGLAARALPDHGCSALGLPYPSVVRAAGWICWMWFGVVQGKNRSGGRRRTDRPDGILQDATARRTVILQDAADVQPVGVGRPTGGGHRWLVLVLGWPRQDRPATTRAAGGHATPYCTSVATRQRPPSPSRFSYPCHHRLHPPACASAICRHAPAC